MLNNQTTIFEMLYPTFKITKPIRLIELFAGYGSQALALKYLGVDFEHWKICEWAVKSIQAYKDIHFTNESAILVGYNREREIQYLHKKGISSNYNKPMTLEQIKRLSDKQIYQITENILLTNNLVNIEKVKGKDLDIKDTDKYCYIMTYSFPCQDLSLAGLGKGMSDTSTRSGLLWEVERILTECKELGTLPQVLLMENVPQVHGVDNVEDFNKWQFRLEELGYKNYWQDLIATDYGIPQTRNRTFMVSILGDYNYTFPKPIPLKLKLKDMLEDKVDEKYFISEALTKYITKNNEIKPKNNFNVIDSYNKKLTNENYSGCIVSGQGRNQGSMIMYKQIIPYGSYYTWEDLQGNINTQCCRAADENRNALTVACANPGNVLIKNATKKGYLEATEGDCIDLCQPNSTTRRGRVQKDKTQTLSTMGGKHLGVVKDLKIRKITPRECFRLMGVKDEDFDKVKKNQSDNSLYHLAGDSIVVNVLMAIFKEMLGE